jgi:hypothetical protein
LKGKIASSQAIDNTRDKKNVFNLGDIEIPIKLKKISPQ